LETYIKDFDILWNRSEISEKNALVFFIRGLEVEVKNLIKMFEPKTLEQAYTFARLQDNTLTHRRYSSNPNKPTNQLHMLIKVNHTLYPTTTKAY